MKMIMRGRKEKKMKEKMTNVTLMNANLPFFNFLQSLGASCSLVVVVVFLLLLCSVALFLRSFFLLYTTVHNLFWRKISSAEFSGKRVSTFSFSKFIFIPSCLNKNFKGSTPPCSVGGEGGGRNLQLPQLCWKLEGARACAILREILAFFLLSPYIGLRDDIVSLCEYGQLAFTNMYLSIFLLFKTKDIFLMGLYRSTKYGFEMIG